MSPFSTVEHSTGYAATKAFSGAKWGRFSMRSVPRNSRVLRRGEGLGCDSGETTLRDFEMRGCLSKCRFSAAGHNRARMERKC